MNETLIAIILTFLLTLLAAYLGLRAFWYKQKVDEVMDLLEPALKAKADAKTEWLRKFYDELSKSDTLKPSFSAKDQHEKWQETINQPETAPVAPKPEKDVWDDPEALQKMIEANNFDGIPDGEDPLEFSRKASERLAQLKENRG